MLLFLNSSILTWVHTLAGIVSSGIETICAFLLFVAVYGRALGF